MKKYVQVGKYHLKEIEFVNFRRLTNVGKIVGLFIALGLVILL